MDFFWEFQEMTGRPILVYMAKIVAIRSKDHRSSIIEMEGGREIVVASSFAQIKKELANNA